MTLKKLKEIVDISKRTLFSMKKQGWTEKEVYEQALYRIKEININIEAHEEEQSLNKNTYA